MSVAVVWMAVLGAVASPTQADWVQTRLLSVVMIDARHERASDVPHQEGEKKHEVGTGLVVGWKDPTLYVVTAAHVVDAANEDFDLKSATVSFSPRICSGGHAAKVVPRAGDRVLDVAVLAVDVPECAARINAHVIQPVRASPALSGSTAASLEHTAMYILARSETGKDNALPVKNTVTALWVEGNRIALHTDLIERGMSGAPVFSDTGELVGIETERQGEQRHQIAWIVKYDEVRNELRQAGVPFDLAGDVCDIHFHGYPAGSTVSVGIEPPELIRTPHPFQPGRHMITVANDDGYQPATAVVDLPPDGSVTCRVTLTRWRDRAFAKTRWPLFIASAGLVVAGAVVLGVASHTQSDFNQMPTAAGYNEVYDENRAANVLLWGGVAGLAAFGIGHAVFTAAPASSLGGAGCGQ